MDGEKIEFGCGEFSGTILDNAANADREGAGFNPLRHRLYPQQNIYRDDAVGLNFEHIINGTARDQEICCFTPRRDRCSLVRRAETCFSICHEAADSTWDIESEMRYTFPGGPCIDLEFSAILKSERFPLGYVDFMWASYMNRTRERRIHFYGMEGEREGWVSFGDDTDEGFETGTVSHHGVEDLPYEEGAATLNILEHPEKKFILPLYYGLVDGDGEPATTEDTMAYIMMFDQRTPIRFAMWNFIQDAEGKPDPHSPAWDWQYAIRSPEIGKRYGYRARVVYKPFEGREDVEREYRKWAKN